MTGTGDNIFDNARATIAEARQEAQDLKRRAESDWFRSAEGTQELDVFARSASPSLDWDLLSSSYADRKILQESEKGHPYPKGFMDTGVDTDSDIEFDSSKDGVMGPDYFVSRQIERLARSNRIGITPKQPIEKPVSSPDSDHPTCSSDAELERRQTKHLEDLSYQFSDLKLASPGSRPLVRSRSQPCFPQTRHHSAFRQHTSSTSRAKPTDSASKSASHASSSSSSSSDAAASSSQTSGGNKRGRHGTGDQDKRRDRNKRSTQDTDTPRLACFYNKHDPLMFGSGGHTYHKFKTCEGRFENMNRLYDHLKRDHSDTFAQCPKCAFIGFRNDEELQTHLTSDPESCAGTLNEEKLIEWMSPEKRSALMEAVRLHARDRRRLGFYAEADKWRFGYLWLFPETNAHKVPSPYPQNPAVCGASFAFDKLEELMRKSSDLDDLKSRFSIMRAQYSAQHGISRNIFEADPPPFPDASTTSGGTSVERQTATESSPDVDEPHRSGFEFRNDEGQVWPSMYQLEASNSWRELDYTPLLFQVPSSRRQLQDVAPSFHSTDARYSHIDASYPRISDDTNPPVMWTGTPAQEYSLSGSMDPVPDESYPQHHPPHAVATQQYQDFGLQDALSGEPLGQDITDSFGTENALWQKFMEKELLGVNNMAG